MFKSLLQFLRFIWLNRTPSFLKKILTPIIEVTYKNNNRRRYQKELTSKESRLSTISDNNDCNLISGPIIVSGFFDEAIGVGRGAHCTLEGLKQSGYNPIAHSIRPLLIGHKNASLDLPNGSGGGVHIMHCNPPEAEVLLSVLKSDTLENKYRIGYWAYELPNAPKSWVEISKFFHEIWVPSLFVKNALEGTHCPIKIMPHDVLSNLPKVTADRKKFNLPDDCFLVMAAGDLRSSSYRKNLFGAIKVFTEAFPIPSKTAALILKVSHKNSDPNSVRKLRDLTYNRPDIILFIDHLSYENMLTLVKSCDLFLSAHRAEGFGLILAESLALNTPVLTTGWSGNLEFMQDMPEALLPYKLVPVTDPSGVYAKQETQVWAEPDISKAAKQLKNIADNSEIKNKIIQTGKSNLKNIHNLWSSKDIIPERYIEKE